MNELILLRFSCVALTLCILSTILLGTRIIHAWRTTSMMWKKNYEDLRNLMAEPMEKLLRMCEECEDGVSCSGCKRFSKYCKKCTEGGG